MTRMQEQALAEGRVLRGGSSGDYQGPALELTLSQAAIVNRRRLGT